MHTTKLTKIGNSTGLTVPRDVLASAGLSRGDEVAIDVRDGKIEITKADDGYNQAMEIGRRFAARYRRTMAILSK
ncbi:AbrB/MazE/SpoVT family DNA-binding domain-containing protein [Skermanella mucosa]|uniref:AbrB/MazE/SpoVT family DNA-binding domain-containing protein n=1 Tax=Skermanella mucosa TaxID=1789672 RepID=UPI00192AB5DD|nr:AbrB/MazE/SpoVT family DNA-binding domain-containing protein [Skermanella mucosa]UEM21161.1 AbrB/MazE/SpoVT family DNA-binding domain-containing protein [Skermanella mucosa]